MSAKPHDTRGRPRLRSLGLASTALLLACSSTEVSTTVDAGVPDAGMAAADAGKPMKPTPSGCTGSSWPEGPRGWELICDDQPVGHFLSVQGCAANDVYMVGGMSTEGGGPGKTVIWHWDGDKLGAVDNPGTERAWWVFCLDEDHVYVVGENGLGLKRIGGGAFEPFDTGTTDKLFGIWGPSSDVLYAVGGDFTSPMGRGRLHRITPNGGEVVDDPPLAAFDGQSLFKVWGSGAGDVFVAGERGTVFHFDGDSWSKMATPSATTPLVTVSGSGPSNVYGVGGRGQGAIWHYDGSDWGDVTPDDGSPGLMGVHTSSGAPVLVAGEEGYVATFTGGKLYSEGNYTFRPLHAVWRGEDGGAWAVGGNFYQPGGDALGVILRKHPQDCRNGISKPGFHHLDLQGRGGAPLQDGSYAMYDVQRGEIHPDLVHGEHYILGAGSFVDFTIPLCADITDRLAFRMPNNDEPGSQANYELFIVREGREILVADALDAEPGNMGYLPFNRSNLPEAERAQVAETNTNPRGMRNGWAEFANAPPFPTAPRDIFARPGDKLLLRVTNVADPMYGLMIWFPQSGLHYQAFLEIEVPMAPGGEEGIPKPPPPEPGPCELPTADEFIELGTGEIEFIPFPPNEGKVVTGPQGSFMFLVAVRGKGFSPGNPSDRLGPESPYLLMKLGLGDYPSDGGRIVADGSWWRAFDRVDDHLVLANVLPTVPVDAARGHELYGATIYVETTLVEAPTGKTFCQRETFTGVR